MAVRENAKHFLRYLLDRAQEFKLNLDPSLLSVAVEAISRDSVAELVKAGLSLTEEALIEARVSFNRRTDTSQYVSFLTFLLQPNYGLTLSQQTFDSLICTHSFTASQVDGTDFLMEMLNRFPDLTVERDIFDQCYEFFPAVLRITTIPRFSHYQPTERMLRIAVRQANLNHVKLFLECNSRLSITYNYFAVAVDSLHSDLIHFLFVNSNVSLTPDQLCQLLQAGKVELVQSLMKTREIRIDFLELLKVAYDFPPISIKFLLNLAAEYGVFPAQIQETVSFFLFQQNLLSVREWLNPRLNVTMPQQRVTMNKGRCHLECYSPVQSHIEIKTALASPPSTMPISFQNALGYSRRQCLRVAFEALLQPSEFGLTDESLNILLSLVQDVLLSDFSNYSYVEKSAIRQYLSETLATQNETTTQQEIYKELSGWLQNSNLTETPTPVRIP
jgi:hypothetical protein